MNLDRLKALIRLANNNPNDNEANLAARKVCKILATDQFQFTERQVKTAAGKMNEARSRPTAPSSKDWEDFMNRHFNATKAWSGFDWSKAPHKDAPEPYWERTWKPNPNIKWGPDGKRERKQELRKCIKCGWETMTFRLDEAPWICNPCHWKDL